MDVVGENSRAGVMDRLGVAAIFADPHVAARQMLVEVEQPDGTRPVTLAGQPIKTTKSYTGIRCRPPLLGEHTAEILAEAGIER